MSDNGPRVRRGALLSVAPMLQWTDRHWRYLVRQITREALLYTEMIPSEAVMYSFGRQDQQDFIGFTKGVEEPLAIQLGGNDPQILSEAAYLIESFGGYSEINLNCGCPSNKAKKGKFGAELMLNPGGVREILSSMIRKTSSTEISVKCRIGLNSRCNWKDLLHFLEEVRSSGVRKVIIHSRICVLHGLSCAQNRVIPPLRYDVCHRVVSEFPDLSITLNGGISSIEEAKYHLGIPNETSGCNFVHENVSLPVHATTPTTSTTSSCDPFDMSSPVAFPQDYIRNYPVDGVMIGRAVYNNPFLLANVDSQIYGKKDPLAHVAECSTSQEEGISLPCSWNGASRATVLQKYFEYCQHAQENHFFGSNICNLLKPIHNFFAGTSFNHHFKRKLDELTKLKSKIEGVTVESLVEESLEMVLNSTEDRCLGDFLSSLHDLV